MSINIEKHLKILNNYENEIKKTRQNSLFFMHRIRRRHKFHNNSFGSIARNGKKVLKKGKKFRKSVDTRDRNVVIYQC